MADATAQAVSKLHDALTAFRDACGKDPACEKIIVLCDATERQLELDYPAEEKREKPGDSDEPETAREDQPKTLKGADAEARSRFAKQRQDSYTK